MLPTTIASKLRDHQSKTKPACYRVSTSWAARWLILLYLFAVLLRKCEAYSVARKAELYREAVDMFYHGYDNYLKVFPEDEIRPVSCVAMTRDREDPSNFVANDSLGNYSLTLIDSLSTLAVLACSHEKDVSIKAMAEFEQGVAALVKLYGDDTGPGARATGFDVDSTVQVFETVIRGVGGLLSAHLFAVGDLPMHQCQQSVTWKRKVVDKSKSARSSTVKWPSGYEYRGQLLHLALDLATRLLPAFSTSTGIPYPRVNLRHGIAFHTQDPLAKTHASDQSNAQDPQSTTETCSAGAGSLVLEFTVLSRLTNDFRFERLAKKAFWAIWDRRSEIDLLGAAIDAVSGEWRGAYTGVGAGIDSYFEYAFKSSVLLSGQATPDDMVFNQSSIDGLNRARSSTCRASSDTCEMQEDDPDAYLEVWNIAHAAVKRHLYSSNHHSHYVLGHMHTGSVQAYWIDALGAFYPGLLTMAGHVEEATKLHLLYTALWTRYSALPERWSMITGDIEGGLGWWLGRPEFIESTYHLYRATGDPWYLHIGEMVMKDIQRYCIAPCGWSGIQDVRTGELNDRMESFFLGETMKYLILLFANDHPLHALDAAWVFSTEGHPLVLPLNKGQAAKKMPSSTKIRQMVMGTCPVAGENIPLSFSVTAARSDVFHASSLVGLNLDTNPVIPPSQNTPEKANGHSYYPWTLSPLLIPSNGTCTRLPYQHTFVVEFPIAADSRMSGKLMTGLHALARVKEGIMVKSLSGLRMGLVQEPLEALDKLHAKTWRIHTIASVGIGRDEQVLIPRSMACIISDPLFKCVQDSVMVDLVLKMTDTESEAKAIASTTGQVLGTDVAKERPVEASPPKESLVKITAITPTGRGAPSTDVYGAGDGKTKTPPRTLTWSGIFFAGYACDGLLPLDAPLLHNLIVIQRGHCSFSQKLANIPAVQASQQSLQLVIVVSGNESVGADGADGSSDMLARPVLDEDQVDSTGLPRTPRIRMVLVGGGNATMQHLKRARSVGIQRRYHVESRGMRVENLHVV